MKDISSVRLGLLNTNHYKTKVVPTYFIGLNGSTESFWKSQEVSALLALHANQFNQEIIFSKTIFYSTIPLNPKF